MIEGVKTIRITKPEEIDNLKSHMSFVFKCSNPNCSKTQLISSFKPHRKEFYKLMLCKKCVTKYTCNKKYGVDYVFQSKEFIDAAKETVNTKYGCDSYMKSSDFRNKSKITMNEKYGVDYSQQSEEVRNKSKQTKLERYGDENYVNREQARITNMTRYGKETPYVYGSDEFKKLMNERYNVDYPLQSKDIMKKYNETVYERYGVNFAFESAEFVDKSKQTKLERYGDEHYNNREKYAETCKSKYGTNSFFESEEFINTLISKYGTTRLNYKYEYIDGETFDSAWELAVWIYFKDRNIEIIREPITFKYTFKNKGHFYTPDFLINNQLVEVKGDQFIKSDGSMYLPFRRPEWSDEEYAEKSGIYEAKHQCGLHHGVEFWTRKDCAFFINYVENVYGSEYLQSFRIPK